MTRSTRARLLGRFPRLRPGGGNFAAALRDGESSVGTGASSALGHRPFEVFKRKLALVGAELLRASTVQRPAKLAKHVFQTTVLFAKQRDLRAKLLNRRALILDRGSDGLTLLQWGYLLVCQGAKGIQCDGCRD